MNEENHYLFVMQFDDYPPPLPFPFSFLFHLSYKSCKPGLAPQLPKTLAVAASSYLGN
jgi:hypothetical protein